MRGNMSIWWFIVGFVAGVVATVGVMVLIGIDASKH
jgi:hypothetical protein